VACLVAGASVQPARVLREMSRQGLHMSTWVEDLLGSELELVRYAGSLNQAVLLPNADFYRTSGSVGPTQWVTQLGHPTWATQPGRFTGRKLTP
jgi:hypothetical protein